MEIVPKYSISTVLIIMTIYFVFSHQYGFGRSPLCIAVDRDNVQMVRLLIQAGAKTNLPNMVNLLNKLQMCMIIKI